MPASPTSSVSTVGSSKTRKKRTIVVVRQPPKNRDNLDHVGDAATSAKKKTVLVSRRPRPSEGRLFENEGRPLHASAAGKGGSIQRGPLERDGAGGDHQVSSTALGKLQWRPNGRVLEKSILGTAEAFEEMDAQLGWARGRPGHEGDLLERTESVRSLHSPTSKQSLRNVKSVERQSSGNCSVSGQTSRDGGSRPRTSSGEQADLQNEEDRYLRRIEEAEETAIRNRATTARKEARLIEHVGLTQKLTIRREGNAMRHWARRLRDWHRVSEDMAAKTGKAPEDLVMSTADEFRERSEEYQLIQSAIPTSEKFSSDGCWVMSLRQNGERLCNVGNMFSGLFCVIEDQIPPPRVVRKPTGRPADATRKRTWRNSEALAMRKTQLAPTLRSLRPQQFQAEETEGLLVAGQDLLKWAATSSTEYFQLRRVQEMEPEIANLRKLEGAKTTTSSAETDERTDTGDPATGKRGPSAIQDNIGPIVEVICPSVLLMESNAGQENLKQAMVTVRNAGSTVLFLSWSRVPRGETIVSINGHSGGGGNDPEGNGGCSGHEGSCAEREEVTSNEAAAARHKALQEPRDRFFCYQTNAALLLGETVTTSFSFKSTDPGVFSDRWRLDTVPPASFVFSSPPTTTPAGYTSSVLDADRGHQDLGANNLASARGDRTGGRDEVRRETIEVDDAMTANRGNVSAHQSNQDEERGDGNSGGGGERLASVLPVSTPRTFAEVDLRGVALAPDTREHARKRLLKGIERGVLAAKVEEIVREVVRGVRTPIREEKIRRRQRKAFLTANAERGLYFTPQLYDGFMSLLQQAKAAALAAQAGAYDETTKCNAVDSDGCAYATLAGERRQQPPLDADDGTGNETTHLNNKESGSANEKESGSRDDDERLSYSTRPPSDVSSGGDDGDDDRQEHKSDPGDAKQSPYGNDGAPGRLEQRTKNVEDDVQNVGGRYLSGVAAPRKLTVEEEAAEGVSEVPAIGVAEDGNGSTATSHQDSSGNNREEAEAVAGKGVSMEALKNMLQMLDCGEWDGAVSTVLDAIESLSKWIPPPTADGESPLDQNKNFTQSGHVDKSKAVFNLGAAVLQGSDNGRGDGGTSSGSQAEADGTEGESDNDGEEEEQEEAEEEATDTDAEDKKEEEEEEEEEADEGGHPIFCKQKALRAQWRRLVLDAQLEPATDCGTIMRDEVGTMLNDIAGAMEEVRRDVGNVTGGAETPRGTVLRYDEESIRTWAAACPVNTFTDAEGGPRGRAAAAAKAGNPQARFLALAYGEVVSKVAAAAERFESTVMANEAGQRKSAATARHSILLSGPDGLGSGNGGGDGDASSAPRLSRLACLSWEDIEGQRILLHIDLSRANEDRSGNLGSDGRGQQLFSELVQLVAEQVREMLSAKPAAVAIVSETSPLLGTDTPAANEAPSSSSSQSFPSETQPPPRPGNELSVSSLRDTAAAVSSLLGMEVEFYNNVPDMAKALGRCNGVGGSPSFGARLMMTERLSAPGVVPAPPVEEPDLSDDEEERLPDFTWGGEAAEEHAKEAEAARAATDGQGDFGSMLAGVIDVVVLDAQRTLYEPPREIPWGPKPMTGITVAGTGLHGDLTAMAYLTESPDRPLLAMIGGASLQPRLKLVDGLLDLVDTLAIGGGLAATFLAAAQDDGCHGRVEGRWANKWGKSKAGQPRDPPETREAARRLLVKARKRGVEVILPSDFVVGDVEVDEHGPLTGQTVPDKDNDNDNDINDADETSFADGESLADAGGSDDGGGGGDDAAMPDVDSDDPAMGFEYDGETIDASLEGGVPRGFRAMDIGPQTTVAFRDAVSRARAILWHGMLGVAECAAFQLGTREVLDAATSAHDSDEARDAGTSPIVILCGRSLGEWTARLVEGDDDAPPLGAGSGVSHVCTDPGFCTRVLEGRFIPGLAQLSVRDRPPGDKDLGKVLRRRSFGDDEEEDEEEEGSDYADSSSI